MLRQRKYVRFIYIAIDIFFIFFSFYLPYCLRYNQNFLPKNLPYFVDYFLLFFIWGLTLIFLLNSQQLYTTDRSLTIPKEARKIIKSVVFSSILAGLVIFLLQMKFFSRLVFGFSAVLLVFNLSIWRIIKRIFLRHKIKEGFYNINVLIIGAGKTGISLVKEIEKNPYLGLKVVGFLDDHKTGKVYNYDILGKISDLENVIKKYFIERVFVTIPSERKKIAQVLDLCNSLKRSVWILPEYFNIKDMPEDLFEENVFIFPQIKVDFLGRIPLLCYIDESLHGTESLIKRIIDVVGASLGLILFFPLFILIGILIKLDSPGPVFYRSIRCGKKGRPFIFYKFRSMYKDADKYKESLRHLSEVKGPVFKIKNDPRITKVGRLLRRYSLDELPQLINVLKGDMSLVGPRPPTPDEVEKYDIWQMKRLEIRPGITGLWQVRGRSDLSFYKWVKWDIWYINNWSLGLDLKILLWTIPAVLKKRGAY